MTDLLSNKNCLNQLIFKERLLISQRQYMYCIASMICCQTFFVFYYDNKYGNEKFLLLKLQGKTGG